MRRFESCRGHVAHLCTAPPLPRGTPPNGSGRFRRTVSSSIDGSDRLARQLVELISVRPSHLLSVDGLRYVAGALEPADDPVWMEHDLVFVGRNSDAATLGDFRSSRFLLTKEMEIGRRARRAASSAHPLRRQELRSQKGGARALSSSGSATASAGGLEPERSVVNSDASI